MRGVMIGLGAALIARFHWVLMVFGVFLVAYRVPDAGEQDGGGGSGPQPGGEGIAAAVSGDIAVSRQSLCGSGGSEASLEALEPGLAATGDAAVAAARPGAWMLTPLAVALVLVEVTDLIFAVDSIPASSRSPPIRSWYSRATSSRSSACDRCISRWRG